MELAFTEVDLAFRDEVREFLDYAIDDELRYQISVSRNGYLPKEHQLRWQDHLSEKGWLAPNWPVEFGGTGWTQTQKYIYETEMAAANAPGVVPFGLRMCAPVIMKFGTDEQRNKYLPDMLANKTWWCQGYSEPGSGSDLASLQMRADDQGDHYLVNGSKIWTSAAQHADMIFCLVRTAKMEKRQDGISFLLIEMDTPGISVEPIITSDDPEIGTQEVNQVFFTDVKVPKENRVGEENKGWTYAKYLLEFERGNAYSQRLRQGLAKVRHIAKAERADGSTVYDDPAFRTKLADCGIRVDAMEFTELRILSKLAGGQNMGPESSLLKCRGTELQQDVTSLALEATGLHAMPFQPLIQGSNLEPIGPDYAPGIAPRFFNSAKVSIYAGSNEVQRNIMAKLILGL
jgi:alkylation response protein AidB-like acyl-CoA dehydrogenase